MLEDREYVLDMGLLVSEEARKTVGRDLDCVCGQLTSEVSILCPQAVNKPVLKGLLLAGQAGVRV